MATSQAKVSRELRSTIREMVRKGKTNQEIYQHIRNEYGPDQIAIPRKGYMERVSYGFPYVAVGLMLLGVYWLGWNWWTREDKHRVPEELSERERKEMDDVTQSIDSPLD